MVRTKRFYLLALALMLAVSLFFSAQRETAFAQTPVINEDAELTPSDALFLAFYGLSVAIDGDTALVGAFNADGSKGAAYVFVYNGSSWSQQAKLTASDSATSDRFGRGVALDGDTALIGAWGKNSDRGAAYVFVRSGTTWTEEAKLTANDRAAGDFFGENVTLDGDTALIGARLDDNANGTNSGSAYIFVRSGSSWSQQAKLTAVDGVPHDQFGATLALDGDTALIGASGFIPAGPGPLPQHFGTAYVFVRSGSSWSQQAKLAASDRAEGDGFPSVALGGDTAIIGAGLDDDNGSASGSAYVFMRNGTIWSQQSKLTASDAAPGDLFGATVALDGDAVVIGATGNDYNGISTGSAYVFARSGTTWTEQVKLNVSSGAANDEFGLAIALSGNTAVLGSPLTNAVAGGAYVFSISQDADGDGISDNTDNAPNDFNPDQSDLDNDGVGDVTDICPTDATDTCDPNRVDATYMIAATGGVLSTNDGSAIVTIPPGAMQQDSSMVVAASDGGTTDFELTTNLGQVLGIFSFDLLPSQTFNLPVTVTFTWDDADNDGRVDISNNGAKEENLIIVKDGVVFTDRCKDDPGCDTVANTFTFQVSSWSNFTLAYPNAPEVTAITAPLDPTDVNNQPTNVSGAFSDLDDDDSHTADWDWGDGNTSPGVVDQANNTVSGSYTYAEAGVYTVKLTVSDSFPLSGEQLFEFVVIYDPAGGFVTGGGWINSPAGAYVADPGLTGKAHFGFVAKYKKGQSTPSGNTQFTFKAGDMNFHSSSYEWLVITGQPKAMYKGAGTINGSGNYGFQLNAIDAQATTNPNDVDTFRIKVWDKDNGDAVVYDNQIGAGDNDDPTTALGGGNIKIHTQGGANAANLDNDEQDNTLFLPLVNH